jgi:uncharacterized protein (UPF0332 family)
MSFDWREFLDIAEALAELRISVSHEALFRSAVSRAYYAAFGAARAQAGVLRASTRKSAAEHGELAAFYTKRFGEAGEQVAVLLNRMRTFRNAADYDAAFDDAGAICQITLKDAHDLLDLLATL